MIPLAEPNLTGKEKEYVADAISSGWVGPDGPYVERFEEMVAKAAGREWAVATTTGTMALYAAAKAAQFDGHPVAVPSNVFPAAANMFRSLGCKVAIYPKWEISNHDHQMYAATGMDGGALHVISDRAPAIGEPPARYAIECYSFAANKIVTCGHGGAVVGDGSWRVPEVRTAIRQWFGEWGGTNGRMANLNAAVGCAQMERLDEFKEKKRLIWSRYVEAGLPMVERGASRWMATVRIDSVGRHIGSRNARATLSDNDVSAREEYVGAHYYCLGIPCSTNLTEADQDKVIKCVKSLL